MEIREKILNTLKIVDERIGKLDRKVNVYLFGSGALILDSILNRLTHDIDCIIGGTGSESKIPVIKDIENSVDFQVVPEGIPLLHPDYKENSHSFEGAIFKNINVKILDIYDIVLTKIGRFNMRDREDLKTITEKVSIDPNLLFDRYKEARKYYVGDLRRIDGQVEHFFDVYLHRSLDLKSLEMDEPDLKL